MLIYSLAARRGMITPLARGIQRAASGWWLAGGISPANCAAAWQPKGAADYASSKINLANPGTYNCSDGTAYPTWNAATGWTFNGTSQFLNSGLVATENMTVIIRIANATTPAHGYPTLFGTYDESNRWFHIHPRSFANRRYYIHGAGTSSYKVGNLVTCVVGIAKYTPYLDGVAETGLSLPLSGWSGTATTQMPIGKRTDGYWYAGDILAMAFYYIELDGTVMAALTTAMNAL